jgi:RNA polymerase sigma-70 factor (ECF subfamily)
MRMRENEFERLFQEHAPGLLAFLAYRLRDRTAAEDVLADTFERVLRTRVRFDRRRGSEKTWLYSIALNLVRDRARRAAAEERAYERVLVAPAGPADELEALGDRDELICALGRLSEEEREAVALRYGGDLTVPEIAKLTGERLTTVEGRVYRALRKLRDLLEPAA